jgi:hypothetical protein
MITIPEKRKVGSSTLPLTTISEGEISPLTCVNGRKRGNPMVPMAPPKPKITTKTTQLPRDRAARGTVISTV